MASRAIDDMKNPGIDEPDRPVAKKENVVRDSDDPLYSRLNVKTTPKT